jgi:hypothetical protein
MKSLRFQKLWLCSELERSGRAIEFHPTTTVVVGENDTGKSSLIKSIYAAFGADPSIVHPRWATANVSILLDFTVDGTPYRILRSGAVFALFNGNSSLVWKETGVSSGVARSVAKLLDFKLELQNRQGEFVTPPPAYGFLPFYVDQDAGWQKTWSSFAGLGQFENFKKDVATFHAGLKPNAYYAARAQKQTADRAKDEVRVERRALDRAAIRLQSNRTAVKFDLKPEAFGDRLDALFQQCEIQRADQEKVQRALTTLHSQRAVLIEQIQIARRALADLNADFEFLRKSVDTEINCPTCGTLHDNDFANKFGLIGDADLCRDFLLEAQVELAKVDREIAEQRQAYERSDQQIVAIQSILDEQRGDIKLRDLIEGESERMVDSAIEAERQTLDTETGRLDAVADEAQAIMKSFDDPARTKKIMTFYRGKMAEFLLDLRVPGLSAAAYSKIDCVIKETGSDLPRALLAYYYAFLHTMREFSGSIACPVILDSPLQQDQDPDNAARVIEFALRKVPAGSQLILGSVSLHHIPPGGFTILTTQENQLLETAAYDVVREELKPLFEQMLG